MKGITTIILILFVLGLSGCSSSYKSSINMKDFRENYKGIKRDSGDASKAKKSIFPNMR
jgi:uncharacterized protein YceK